MQADFALELGTDDEALEMPWEAGESGPRYYDLKRHPELLANIEEAGRVPELGEFLRALNSPNSMLETAKCDVWSSTEITAEDEILGATHKFGCYVDLLFCDEKARFSLPEHELSANRLAGLLRKVPEIPAAAEFMVRRCYYHKAQEIQDGFYITCYLFGYGDDEPQARQRWAIALKLAENAIWQLSTR